MSNNTACLFCEEPFDDRTETVIAINDGQDFAHQACLMRGIIGGLNCQRRTCGCHGGIGPADPPGLTLREAAQAAFRHYRQHGVH